jgi:multimeric flavodoxin WrbA
MKLLIINGSARKNGSTAAVVAQLQQLTGWDAVHLSDYSIGYYDYEHRHAADDFLPLVTRMIEEYDVLIFATPVYWYSMSGQLKVFFDRITDLLDNHKDLGRKLRGKYMAAISSSGGDDLGETFWLPISESARYLGMHYLGHVHTYPGRDEAAVISNFIEQIKTGTLPDQV